MKVKAIRGSIKYNGIVYDEGDVFDIEAIDLDILRENIEVVEDTQQDGNIEDSEDTQYSDSEVIETNLDDVDLNTFNISELKKIAKEKDVKLPEKATKQDIIKAIEESE